MIIELDAQNVGGVTRFRAAQHWSRGRTPQVIDWRSKDENDDDRLMSLLRRSPFIITPPIKNGSRNLEDALDSLASSVKGKQTELRALTRSGTPSTHPTIRDLRLSIWSMVVAYIHSLQLLIHEMDRVFWSNVRVL